MTTPTIPARAGWLSRHPRARLLAAFGYGSAAVAFFTHQKLFGSDFGVKVGALLLAFTAGLAVVEAVRLIYVRAGQRAAVPLPVSLRELADFVDISAAAVLAEGHAAGVDAADRALDRVGDATQSLVEEATARRVLEAAFERSAAGRRA